MTTHLPSCLVGDLAGNLAGNLVEKIVASSSKNFGANLGAVTFVGAGPGSADLITVRGLKAIEAADCILYDALIDDALLAHAPNALKLPVGKRAGKASTEQAFIDRLLVSSAKRFQNVVRLKGGDPSLFGRLDEEMAALDAENIEYSVVPGVTSALAAAAAIKRPLTQRGVARRVVFATPSMARGAVKKSELRALSPQSADTLALYMAGRDRAAHAQQLIDFGWPEATPAALVWSAGSDDVQSQTLTLKAIVSQRFLQTDIASTNDAPLMILIGKALRSNIVKATQSAKNDHIENAQVAL